MVGGQEHVRAQVPPASGVTVEKYPLWALDNTVEGPDRNVPDPVLRGVWRRLVEADKVRAFFPHGRVTEEEHWMEWVKSPHHSVVFQIDRDAQEICLFAVLTDLIGRAAQGHFCNVLPYQRGMGTGILDFWASLQDCSGKPLLNLVWGSTPAQSRAVKLVELLGFTLLGTIPHLFHGQGATISFLDLEVYRNG